MTTIQILAVQQPAGRKHEYLRIMGHRVDDPKMQMVEVAVSVVVASEILANASKHHVFPEIEVPDNSWCYCANLGDMEMIQMQGKP